tara:strand:- start:23 stop:1300 length:1278 start_codon:yes stop_codon:yes gene_type:complete
MQRDKRVQDNWALIFAQKLAIEYQVPLLVCYSYIGQFPKANLRQYEFLFRGLEQTAQSLNKLNIDFHLIKGDPKNSVLEFIDNNNVGTLITDFSPLNVYQNRIKKVSKLISIPFFQVDAHNIIPVWLSSDKQEWGAYTFRPKLLKLLPEYLIEFPKVIKHPFKTSNLTPNIILNNILSELEIDRKVKSVESIFPGEKMALKLLGQFMNNSIDDYTRYSNNPNYDVLTNLSPYLHYGHISPQRVALELSSMDRIENKSVMEQLIVRRELAENFCYYNNNYDSFDGFPNWAKDTLKAHYKDKREFLYSFENFESADIHDELWNAAQIQMMKTGKMHSYMRMYWAKKILEWSSNPEIALQTAIDLNDKYELDGRDPNGYTGIAWSIGGVHDRAWFERPIYGKIRYMNYNGCSSKFDVKAYIKKINEIK